MREDGAVQKKLKFSAYAGIIYLVAFLPELIIEILREIDPATAPPSMLLKFAYIVSIPSAIIFFYGFIVLRYKFKNNLVVVGSIIIILTTVFYYIWAWYTIDIHEVEKDIVGGSFLFLFGFSGILFGIGLRRLRGVLDSRVSAAGILEIIIGITNVTIILFFLGLILSIAAIILEILVLLKTSELPAEKEEDNSLNKLRTAAGLKEI